MATLALGLAIACGGSGSLPEASPGTTSLTVLYPGDERILSPYWEMPAKFLMFEPLVRTGEDGELEGRLADSWEWSEDGTSVLVRLRPGVTWHDGIPFSARDVEFTYRLWAHQEVARLSPGTIDVDVIDEATVRITSRSASASPLSSWDVFYPRHLLEDLDPAHFMAWDFWVQPVGNGPYRYLRHVPKTMMAFEAYGDYYDGRPGIDRLILKFGSGGPTRVTELLGGEVDAVGWAQPEELRLLGANSSYEAHYEHPPSYRAIVWNVELPQLRDARVRRALTRALDRPEIVAARDMPPNTPLFDTLPLSDTVPTDPDPLSLFHDPGRARALLEEAGWDRRSDGVRHREGRPLAFTLTVAGEDERTAVLVQEQLNSVGADVSLEVLRRPMVRSKWREGDFEAVLMILSESRLSTLFGPDGTSGYANPLVTENIAAAEAAPSRRRRRAILADLEQVFLRDQPATVLYPGVNFFIVPAWLRGLSSPYRADPLVNLDRLWVDVDAYREQEEGS